MAKGKSKAGGGSSSAGLYVEGSPGNNQKEADELIQGAKDVLADFGFSQELRGIYFNDKGALFKKKGEDAAASMNGAGDLYISTAALQSKTKDSKGYLVSDTFYGTGAHEAGHAVVNGLLKNNVSINPGDASKTPGRANLERATARSKGKLEKYIVKEAIKRYGSNPKISGYGSTHVREKVAEAVSDVYTNKSKANPFSREIVGVMKDIKSGKLKPVLKVSKSEMGI